MGDWNEKDWFDKDASEVRDPELTLEIDGRTITADDLDNAYDEEAARNERVRQQHNSDEESERSSTESN